MALFSDGPPSAISDLTQEDSFLISVSSTEGIDVTNKLNLAYSEVTVELNAIFNREASIYAPVLGEAPLDTNHLSVTPALKSWHMFKSLELTYRDAYFSQLNDRYQAKWQQYQQLALQFRGLFIDTGAGLVIDPLPLPGQPIVSLQPASQAAGTGYVAITFVNAESQESSPSTVLEVSTTDGEVAVVAASFWPSNAVGWNFYASATPTSLSLQNPSTLTLGSTWEYLLPGIAGGVALGTGQSPDVTRDLPRRIMRG